jgi:hypothetical protein
VKRNYLRDCFEAFQEVAKEKYGTAQDLAAIELAVSPLRNRRTLTELAPSWWTLGLGSQ